MTLKIAIAEGREAAVSEIEIRNLYAAGVITDDTHVSRDGTPTTVSSVMESPGDVTSTPDLRPIARRHDWFKGALIAFIIACILLGLSNLHAAQVLNNLVNGSSDHYNYPEQVGALADFHQSITGLLYLLSFFACVIFFSLFFYRALRNVRQLEATEAEMQPGWIVGWNFVPIANLFMPFSGVRQVWQSSRRLAGETFGQLSTLHWWWAGWIIVSLVSNFSSRMGTAGVLGDITNYNAYITGLRISAVTEVGLIASSILLLKIIKQIDDAQGAFLSPKTSTD